MPRVGTYDQPWFPAALRLLRRREGLTQGQLAERVGERSGVRLSTETVRRYERQDVPDGDRRAPSLTMLAAILDALEVSREELEGPVRETIVAPTWSSAVAGSPVVDEPLDGTGVRPMRPLPVRPVPTATVRRASYRQGSAGHPTASLGAPGPASGATTVSRTYQTAGSTPDPTATAQDTALFAVRQAVRVLAEHLDHVDQPERDRLRSELRVLLDG